MARYCEQGGCYDEDELSDRIFKWEVSHARKKYWPLIKTHGIDFYRRTILSHMMAVADTNSTILADHQVKRIMSISVEVIEIMNHKITKSDMAIRDDRHMPWLVPAFGLRDPAPAVIRSSITVSRLAAKDIVINGISLNLTGASAERWDMDQLYGEKPRSIVGWTLELDMILAEAVLKEITNPAIRSFVVDSFLKAVAIIGHLMPNTYNDAFSDSIWAYKERAPKKPIPPVKQEIEFVPLKADQWSNRGYYITK